MESKDKPIPIYQANMINLNNIKENKCFIKWLFEESGSIDTVRNILAVFKVYCPKHTELN